MQLGIFLSMFLDEKQFLKGCVMV